MGLYLAVFDDGDEIDGVEVGSYADFAFFRDAVVSGLEGGVAGSRFPTLIVHSDCDGEWTPYEAGNLEAELAVIAEELQGLPPVTLDGWKAEVAKMFGIKPTNLADCFFDVDGEPLLERIIGLAQLSQQRDLPILFQ
jgi:hypothetical protein